MPLQPLGSAASGSPAVQSLQAFNQDSMVQHKLKPGVAEVTGTAMTLAPLRVMQVIAAIASAEDGLSLGQLCEQLGVPKSSLFSLLRTLHSGGYIESDGGHHRLGEQAYNLAGVISRGRSFPGNLRSTVMQLHNRCGETVMIQVPGESWTEMVCIDVVESNHWLRFKVNVGMRRPLYSTAPGLAMLAFAPREVQQHYVETTQLTRFTPDTVTTRKALLQQLAKARAECVVVSCASVEGATGVSAPIFGPDGEVRATVSIAGLSVRIERNVDKLSGMVRVAAEQMSRVLGFAQAYPPNPPS